MQRILVIGSTSAARQFAAPLHGFTLLELMVVMMVLVLVSTAIPFSISHALPGRRVKVATEQLNNLLTEARSESRRTNQQVKIEVLEHALVLSNNNNISLHPEQKRVDLPRSTVIELYSVDGHASSTVDVYPDGSTSGGAVNVKDGNHLYTARLSPLTGRMSAVTLQ